MNRLVRTKSRVQEVFIKVPNVRERGEEGVESQMNIGSFKSPLALNK